MNFIAIVSFVFVQLLQNLANIHFVFHRCICNHSNIHMKPVDLMGPKENLLLELAITRVYSPNTCFTDFVASL